MTTQPTLGSRTGKILKVDGLEFRDLDGDGSLAAYEDWRLSPGERARDLVTRMNTEEKVGLMLIGPHHPGYSTALPEPVEGQLLNETDVWHSRNPITNQEYPKPVLVTSATESALNLRHQRHFIVQDNLAPRDLATWTNAVQEVAEKSRLGIPAVFASTPRNHVSLATLLGVGESAGAFSEWPGELGLAALRDPALMETFGRELAREWRAGGIHKLYGYLADAASEPCWSSFNDTFGEDPQLVADYIAAVVRGMQGEQLSETSVAAIIKHSPDGGDPHFARAVKNGTDDTDTFAGMSDPADLLAAVEQGHLAESELDQTVTRILTEMFALGLFENPFVEVDRAAEIIGGSDIAELGARAQRRSVTLLRDSQDLLPLERYEGTRMVYLYVTGRTRDAEVQKQFEAAIQAFASSVSFVEKPEDADVALVWVRPEISHVEGDREDSRLSVDPRDNGVDVDQVMEIEKLVPTILIVNMTNPWLLGEIEPAAGAVVATYDITPENLLKSLAGWDGGPQGKLPLSVPFSQHVIETSPQGIPGKVLHEEDGNYAYLDRSKQNYTYGHGLNFGPERLIRDSDAVLAED